LLGKLDPATSARLAECENLQAVEAADKHAVLNGTGVLQIGRWP